MLYEVITVDGLSLSGREAGIARDVITETFPEGLSASSADGTVAGNTVVFTTSTGGELTYSLNVPVDRNNFV